MTNGFDEMILNMTDTTPEPEDYTGADGLLYCEMCIRDREYSKEDLMEAKKQIWGVGENMGTEESKKIWAVSYTHLGGVLGIAVFDGLEHPSFGGAAVNFLAVGQQPIPTADDITRIIFLPSSEESGGESVHRPFLFAVFRDAVRRSCFHTCLLYTSA